MSLRAGTYEDALARIAAGRPEVVVLTAENRAPIRGLARHLGDRFIDVGICEQTLVGVAAGLALRGRIPVVHALASFLTMRAFEFIRTDVGLAGLPVKLVGYVPGLLSEGNGPTHQAVEDLALMRSVPGMQIVCPADAAELAAALPAIVDSPAPCYVRYTDRESLVDHRQPFALGRAERLAEGGDVALLAVGLLVEAAMAARTELARRGIAASVWNLRTLVPLDEGALRSAAKARLVVTLEDHRAAGGLFGATAEWLARQGGGPAVLPVALKDEGFAPGALADVLVHEGLTGSAIARRVLSALKEMPECRTASA